MNEYSFAQIQCFEKDTILQFNSKFRPIPSTLHVLQYSDSIKTEWIHTNLGEALKISGIPHSKEVCITYSEFPYPLQDSIYKFHQENEQNKSIRADLITENKLFDDIHQQNRETSLLSDEKIQKSGSLSRGVSVGNAQDLFVNSTLQLQIQGNITDSITIEAQISDQNVPYQAEGNSYNLQEFDRVWVHLSHPIASISAGDLRIRSQQNHYLKYLKNVSGIELNLPFQTKKFTETSFLASYAKGQFHTGPLVIREGIQGPYRLSVPGASIFMLILAGSEKIFLDERLLERGSDRDYVIDYNTAELTFTPKILISRTSVVRVEFEYAVQNYARSLYRFRHQQQVHTNGYLYAEYYTERDQKNQPFQGNFSQSERSILMNAGDVTESLLVPSISQVDEFQPNTLLYTKKDTLWEGEILSYYTLALPSDTSFYRLSFLSVDEGAGSYVRSTPTANGQAFTFVGPNKGNYEPIQRLQSPNKKEMWVVGYQSKYTTPKVIEAEIAISSYDKNTFSSLDSKDNIGFAGYISYQNKVQLGQKKGSTYSWKTSLEAISPYLKEVDRFRDPQFQRYWDSDSLAQGTEILPSLEHSIRVNSKNNTNKLLITEHLKYRNRDSLYQGQQYFHKIELQRKKSSWNLQDFRMNAVTNSYKSTWARSEANFNKTLKKSEIQSKVQKEKHERAALSDSLLLKWMDFEMGGLRWLSSQDSQRTNLFQCSYEFRRDFTLDSVRSPYLRSHTFASTWETRNKYFKWEGQMQGRIFSDDIANLRFANFWSGGTIASLYNKQKSILITGGYRTSSGQELRRELVFIPVDAGQGTHAWRDDNGDGIQQLQEFYEAINPDEKTFVKYWMPSTQYTDAIMGVWDYKFQWKATNAWKPTRLMGKILKIAQINSQISLQRKVADTDWVERLLPINSSENILSERYSNRQYVQLGRNNSKWIFLTQKNVSRTKTLLSQGFESRNRNGWTSEFRWNTHKQWSPSFKVDINKITSRSDFMENKNFAYSSLDWQASLQIVSKSKFRFVQSVQYKKKIVHLLLKPM